MVIGDEAPDAVILPGLEVTVYEVTVTLVGAVKEIVACPFEAVALTLVGAFGTGAIVAQPVDLY